MSNEAVLKDAFVRGLGVSADEIDWANLSYRGIAQWDSVAHMQVVAEIEEAFDLMLETDDIIAMSDFNAVKEILTKYALEFS